MSVMPSMQSLGTVGPASMEAPVAADDSLAKAPIPTRARPFLGALATRKAQKAFMRLGR